MGEDARARAEARARLRLGLLAATLGIATLAVVFWPRIAREGSAAAKANLAAAASEVLASPGLRADASIFAQAVVTQALADPATHAALLRAGIAVLRDPAAQAETRRFLYDQLLWLAAEPWFIKSVSDLLQNAVAGDGARDALADLGRRSLEEKSLRTAGSDALVAAARQALDDKALQAQAERWVWEVLTPRIMRSSGSAAPGPADVTAAASAAAAAAAAARGISAPQQQAEATPSIVPVQVPPHATEAKEYHVPVTSASVPVAAPPPLPDVEQRHQEPDAKPKQEPKPLHASISSDLDTAATVSDTSGEHWWRGIWASRRLLSRRPFRPAAVDGGFGEALSDADWAAVRAMAAADAQLRRSPLHNLWAATDAAAQGAAAAWRLVTAPPVAPVPPTPPQVPEAGADEAEVEARASRLANELARSTPSNELVRSTPSDTSTTIP